MEEDVPAAKESIITSLFSRRDQATGDLEETYVSHVKVWEEDGKGPMKPRYILLSVKRNGAAQIYKAKRNTNGSFSIGKAWRLDELRGVEAPSPQEFSLTMARAYRWSTERAQEQLNFLVSIIRLHRKTTGGQTLQIVGVQVPERDNQANRSQVSLREEERRGFRPQTPPVAPPVPRPTPSRTPSRNQASAVSQRDMTRPPSVQGLVQKFQSRPSSPALTPQTPPRQIYQQPNYPPSSSRSANPAIVFNDSDRNPSPSPSRRVSSPKPSVLPIGRIPSASGRTSTVSQNSSRISLDRISVTQAQSPIPPLPPSPALPTPIYTNRTPSPAMPPPSSPAFVPPSPAPPRIVTSYDESPSYSDSPEKRSLSPIPPSPRLRTPSPTSAYPRGDPTARVSFFDPGNQSALDRLLAQDTNQLSPGTDDDLGADAMAYVEDMLESLEWGDLSGNGQAKQRMARGAADQIEARLLDELTALEKANVYSFLESDDRIAKVLGYIDDALRELDEMEGSVSAYKIHLNAVGDDISYIQSQNRGLQVQTQNQQALLSELEQLLLTVHVDRDALVALTQGSLESERGITRLEDAATELYKALQAGKDTEMSATMERFNEYRTHNSQFCKRLFDFLSIMFKFQADNVLNSAQDKSRGNKSQFTITDHEQMETYLRRYSGLILYLKEMDEDRYGKVCALYFSITSELHNKQMRAVLTAYAGVVKKVAEDTEETFGPPASASAVSRAGGTVRRAGTIVRAPLERRQDKDKAQDAEMRGFEAYGRVLGEIAPQIYREQEFIAEFLQINDQTYTFADYMNMESYFRRQAARSAGLGSSTVKLVQRSMELIYGFLAPELKKWIDATLQRDNLQLIGIMAYTERFMADAEEHSSSYFRQLLQKQLQRMSGLFKNLVDEQIKAIEQTKLTTKKRKGVAHFIKYFPIFVGKIEAQLVGADDFGIRKSVDETYEQIVQVMFECLVQMAKMDGNEPQALEDKGLLNYHVILIENMHHFVAEISRQDVYAMRSFARKAEGIYEENLSSYVKLALRRPLAKILDYFDGVERLLQAMTPADVANNSSYNKLALKRVVKEYNTKDLRRSIDVLYKRVEKHFSQVADGAGGGGPGEDPLAAGSVIADVWKACEEELVRSTERFTRLIARCYPESGVSLEYTVGDVETCFKRHK
ncbi:hypothetical protein BOTBODRAFT_27319 [Botryobasidium botryosum FD-172 SS1]|uniref:Exocyst complex component Sec3 PIP2-binding N-terminal domain-containing protein n=1 Tax=Botryobasidium botryosum (strain FD-172 SS1) TaxID=930990 RepID=A0A067MVY9_BOTB1|nr:hypothetical protein BOTBODRAFT_27319 [Botryobasidium botryosum FD-172 SS1]